MIFAENKKMIVKFQQFQHNQEFKSANAIETRFKQNLHYKPLIINHLI